MNARTKACAISRATKEAVYKRDRGRCIFCGKPGLPEAHYIPRSHGGLGIEQNIITACRLCHGELDQTTKRSEMLDRAREHLEMWYPNFSDADRIYRRN